MTRQIWLRLTGKFYRFGYACVSFGRPISLNEFMATHPTNDIPAITSALGDELMTRIGRVVPVLPVSLVSTVLLRAQRPMSMLELKAKCHDIWQQLSARGVYSHIPHEDEDYAVEVGLRMLTLRHMVSELDGKFALIPAHSDVVEYYANAIAHHFEATQHFS